MNVIDQNVMAELNQIIDHVVATEAIKGCVITSGKEAFSGGADLTMLQGLGMEYAKLVKTKGEEPAMAFFFEATARLSLLYRKLETCGSPSRRRCMAPASAALSNSRSPAISGFCRIPTRPAWACRKSRSGSSPARAAPSVSRA